MSPQQVAATASYLNEVKNTGRLLTGIIEQTVADSALACDYLTIGASNDFGFSKMIRPK